MWGFLQKIDIPNVYKEGENDHELWCPYKPYENSFISSLFTLVKSIEEKIQLSDNHVDTIRDWTLEQLQEPFQGNLVNMFSYTYKMIRPSVFGPSVSSMSNLMYYITFDVLIKILEGLWTSNPDNLEFDFTYLTY